MLSDAKVRKIKAEDRPQKHADGGGLFLYVTPAGARTWRFRYRVAGAEKQVTLGHYPDMSIAEARAARDEAKAVLKSGRDPVVVKRQIHASKLDDASNTFERIAREWHALRAPSWADKHAQDVLISLERDVFPHIGKAPIGDLTARRVLEVVREIENRGATETARRIRQRISGVFAYGIAIGLCESDPAAQIKSIMAPVRRARQPAVTTLEDLRAMLRAVEATPAHPVTKLAHRLLALTVLRPGTIITTPWSELDAIDDHDAVWVVPSERMKLKQIYKGDEKRDHLVPLSRQALEVIEAARQFTGRGPYAFPNSRFAHRTMSENAIGYLLNRAGYHHKHVPHGWRSAFSTVMNERHPLEGHIIDFALAHVPKNQVEAAYNRALYLERRREHAQEWADLILDGQRDIAELTKMPRRVYR